MARKEKNNNLFNTGGSGKTFLGQKKERKKERQIRRN
jgi:hypothetical protein